jgi:hypothetical protein
MYPPGVMTLVHGSAAVPDASVVGGDRVVHVYLGADGQLDEVDGLGYRLISGDANGALSATFTPAGGGAAALGACAGAAGDCADATEDGLVAHVGGAGTIDLVDAAGGRATLAITGPAGAMELRFRR